jgi:hypothetical protein
MCPSSGRQYKREEVKDDTIIEVTEPIKYIK